jgi:hypothetical protein
MELLQHEPNAGKALRPFRVVALVGILSTLWVTGLGADFAVFRAPSHIMSCFALPGETVAFDLATYAGTPRSRLGLFEVESDVPWHLDEETGFLLTAPETAGIYSAVFREPVESDTPRSEPYRVHLVVMHPTSEVRGGLLRGYPVGAFPTDRAGERWRFQQPRGFVEITEENMHTLLSDHFTLADLDCKLDVPYPHYAAIQTSLLIKLEGLSYKLLERGLPGDHVKIMSGFRTPDYNRIIGNRTTYSRHIAGDAADIFVDKDGDDRMDDLNGDGRINRRDSRFLLAIVDGMDQSSDYGPLVGGASAYRANHDHGPFVHIDTRGYPARW